MMTIATQGSVHKLRRHFRALRYCFLAGATIFFGMLPDAHAYRSCNDIKTAGASIGSGIYTVDPDDGGPLAPVQVRCDMDRDGGGWTLGVKAWYQGGVHGITGPVGTVVDGPTLKGNPYKLADDVIRAIIGPTENFDILADQNGYNPSYSTGNYEYVVLRNYTGQWRFDGPVAPSATQTVMQSYRAADGALAWTGELLCGLGGFGINCLNVLTGPNPAGGAGCTIAMGTLTHSSWHHFYMGDVNTDTYLYICNGAQHSSGNNMNHRFWFRETNPIAVPEFAFLHGSGANANPSVLFLDSEAPTSSTAKHKDSAAIKFSGGNPWKLIGTWTAEPEFFAGSLTTLGDLRVWLGLKNSDDVGTRFDLAAEVWKNGTLVAEGETLCITGVTRNPSLAKEVTVTFQPFSPVTFDGSSDVLSLKLLTRIGTNGSGGFCGGHSNAAGLRLYFDAVDRDAGFSANGNSAGDSGWIDWTNKSTTSVSGHIPNTQITATITAESPTAEDMSISTIDDTFNWVAAWFTPNLPNSDAIWISNSVANSNDLWRIEFSQPVTNPQIHFLGMERTYSFNSNIELVSAGSSFVVSGSTIEGIRGCDPGGPKSGTLRMLGTFTEITIQGSGIAECGHNRDAIQIQVGVNIP
jgi:hypothetical protein